MLDEPLSSSLMGSTCTGSHLLHLGRWGSHRGDRSAAPGRDLSPPPQSLKSLCSDRQREGRESSKSCILAVCWAFFREGCVRFQQSLSHCLSDTPHPTPLLLLPSGAGTGAGPSLALWRQRVPTGAPSGQVCHSWWLQRSEGPWLSAGWRPLLPG